MDVNLSPSGFYLNGLLIERNLTKVSETVALLEENYREIELRYGIRLLVFDNLGVRVWAKGNLVSQAQIVLSDDSEEQDEKMPREFFRGAIRINEQTLFYPIYKSEIEAQVGALEPDDDSRRYGVNMFHLYLGERKFAFWLDKKQEQVNSFYS